MDSSKTKEKKKEKNYRETVTFYFYLITSPHVEMSLLIVIFQLIFLTFPAMQCQLQIIMNLSPPFQ